MLPTVRRPSRRGWLFLVLPCLFAAGCGNSDDGIKTYRVANPEEKGKADDKPAVADPGPGDPNAKVRFIGAVVPIREGENYFVRFADPITSDKIDPLEKDFDTFLSSVRVPGEGGKPISWTVPPGWKDVTAPPTPQAGFVVRRVVSLEKDGGSPQMYISEPVTGSVLSNVNRWRTSFAGLKPVTEAELPGITKEVQLGGTKAFKFDFRGPGGKGGMMPPFAK